MKLLRWSLVLLCLEVPGSFAHHPNKAAPYRSIYVSSSAIWFVSGVYPPSPMHMQSCSTYRTSQSRDRAEDLKNLTIQVEYKVVRDG